jgi:hypothetical protein
MSAAEKTPEQIALDERLAKAKAARQRVAEEKAAREAAGATLAAVQAEELAALDEAAIEKAESEVGLVGAEIALVKTPAGVVIVKRPQKLLYRVFQHSKMNDVDMEKLVGPCLVHPDRVAFDALQERWPALLMNTTIVIGALAGAGMEKTAGKS